MAGQVAVSALACNRVDLPRRLCAGWHTDVAGYRARWEIYHPAHRRVCVHVDSGQPLSRLAGDDRTNLSCRCLGSRWMLPLLRDSCRDGTNKHSGTTGSPRVGSVSPADYGAARHRPEKFLNLRDCREVILPNVTGFIFPHPFFAAGLRAVLAFRAVRAIFARYPG